MSVEGAEERRRKRQEGRVNERGSLTRRRVESSRVVLSVERAAHMVKLRPPRFPLSCR